MDDVLQAGVSVLTIGQYLQPSRKNIPVSEYVTPERFEYYRQQAVNKGFKKVESARWCARRTMRKSIYDS